MHIVHQREWASGLDDLLVIGVLLDVGTPSRFLEGLGWSSLPAAHQVSPTVSSSVHLAAAFTHQLAGGFYRYDGSLTTPPCTESVKWFVLQRRATVSQAQVDAFKALFPDPANNRPTQPLGDRHVVMSAFATSHWGYTLPWDNSVWEAESATCGTGVRQSPVDIDAAHLEAPTADHAEHLNSVMHFTAVAGVEVQNNGHAITVPGTFGSTTTSDARGGAVYNTLGFHFHFPSEHTINGAHAAGEMHMVHQREGTSGLEDLLVIGVLLDVGDPNAFLDTLGWSALPAFRGATPTVSASVDVAAAFADQLAGGFYR
jgi:carbonic anhydrase